jgi:hypothetical protein
MMPNFQENSSESLGNSSMIESAKIKSTKKGLNKRERSGRQKEKSC